MPGLSTACASGRCTCVPARPLLLAPGGGCYCPREDGAHGDLALLLLRRPPPGAPASSPSACRSLGPPASLAHPAGSLAGAASAQEVRQRAGQGGTGAGQRLSPQLTLTSRDPDILLYCQGALGWQVRIFPPIPAFHLIVRGLFLGVWILATP